MADSPADKMMEMLFPLNGVNVATAFDQQPVQSTPVGVNVRCQEPLGLRLRGGSRPGISKFISAQVNGSHLIQCLDTVTWTSPLALLDPPVDPTTGVTDPSNLGRGGELVRKGGSGHQLGGGRSKSKKYELVQKTTAVLANAGTINVTLPAVALDNLLVVVAGGFISINSLTDSLGNSFDLFASASGSGVTIEIADGTVAFPGTSTLSVDVTIHGCVVFLEYKNNKVLGPEDSAIDNDQTGGAAGSLMTTTPIPVHNSNSLLIGAFAGNDANPSTLGFAVGSGARLLANLADGGPFGQCFLFVEDLIGPSVDTELTATMTGAGGTMFYKAVGASFKPK